MITKIARACTVCAVMAGCSSAANPGIPGDPAVRQPNVTGTVFTIIFENENVEAVLNPSNPFFYAFAKENGQAHAYSSTTHPSLPNYIMLTSGATSGIVNDNDPLFAPRIAGTNNLADQLEGAGIEWRAYMESMGTACNRDSNDLYSAHHNPFIYYQTMIENPQRCRERVVDFDQNFEADLASNRYRYMWITPNMCNDMHDCPMEAADAWLQRVTKQIMDSPGYKNGGALFVLFDEGKLRVFGAGANLATIIASPNLVSRPYESMTSFDHASYVATVEDIFGLPRIKTTKNSVPMDEFFTARSTQERAQEVRPGDQTQ